MKKLVLSLGVLVALSACSNDPISFKVIEEFGGNIGCGDGFVDVEEKKIFPDTNPKWLNALTYLSEIEPDDGFMNPLYDNLDTSGITVISKGAADVSAAIDFGDACNRQRIEAMLEDLGDQLGFVFSVDL